MTCSNRHFDAQEKQAIIDLLPIRFTKVEEHTTHVEGKISALEKELHEITDTTKTFIKHSTADIIANDTKVNKLFEMVKTNSSRIDELKDVLVAMGTMFKRYGKIVDFIETKIRDEIAGTMCRELPSS